MKRSKMYEFMVKTFLDDLPDLNNVTSLDIVVYMDTLLKKMEKKGMKPPGIAVKKLYPNKKDWGSLCSMRCDCEDCNPDFIVHEWEKE